MKTGYLRGVLWILVMCFVSASNDMICKLSGVRLSGVSVLFFRFLWSSILLLPWVMARPKQFATQHLKIHAVRGGLFAIAMLPWCYGLIALPMPLVTAISFTTPLFVTILAQIFLKESVGWHRLSATLLGFIGIIVSVGLDTSLFHMNSLVWLALVATFLFAVLDVVNKRLLVVQEGIWPMVFFSSIWTTVFTFPLVILNWQTPTISEMMILALLGGGGNLLLWALLKASDSCDLSALQPFRYVEFLFSCALSIIVFHQWPDTNVLIGMAFLVPSTLYLSHHELRLERRSIST
jgi:S-adenosylmethionine uptake transporter